VTSPRHKYHVQSSGVAEIYPLVAITMLMLMTRSRYVRVVDDEATLLVAPERGELNRQSH
jgi:hypothetical protein